MDSEQPEVKKFLQDMTDCAVQIDALKGTLDAVARDFQNLLKSSYLPPQSPQELLTLRRALQALAHDFQVMMAKTDASPPSPEDIPSPEDTPSPEDIPSFTLLTLRLRSLLHHRPYSALSFIRHKDRPHSFEWQKLGRPRSSFEKRLDGFSLPFGRAARDNDTPSALEQTVDRPRSALGQHRDHSSSLRERERHMRFSLS